MQMSKSRLLVEIRVVHCYSRSNKHKNYLFIIARTFYVIFLLAFSLINSTMHNILWCIHTEIQIQYYVN